MVEARVNGATKDKKLKRLFRNSKSTASDPTRLAFVLIPQSMADHCKGQHVRQALQGSPVDEQGAYSVASRCEVEGW